MKRNLRFILPCAFAALLLARANAQNDVLKPFRPGGDKPTTEESAPPLKPFKPAEEPPKALPVKPKPADPDADIPKALPVKKPTPVPTDPSIVTPPRPAGAEPVSPKPAEPVPPRAGTPQKQAPSDSLEGGDIVVRSGGNATTADQVQLQYADGFYSRKMWRDAVPEYESYLQTYTKASPEDRQAAYYRLAECYRLTDAINNAKANYEAVIANFNGGDFVGYAAYRLGTILYDEKDYRGALPVYRRASVRLKQPTLINASKFFVGRCLEATGQKTEAKVQYEDLSQIIEGNPYRDASRLSTARLLEEANQRDAALKWLLPLVEETSNPQIKADATARAGMLQLELGQLDAATKTINAALALPDIGAAKDRLQVALFRVMFEKKDYKGLLARFEQGGANGLNLEAKLNVLVLAADANRELGQRDAAMALYDQIMRDFPATLQAREAGYARLVMLYDTGDARLLDEVNKFLTENPTAPQVERVSLMKAEALFKAGDFEHAAPIYQIVVEKSKGLAGAFKGEATFKLGWCWMQLRYFDRAVTTFTTFVKDYPTHAKVPTALAQRGAAQMQLKQFVPAQKDFQELTTKYPKSKEREFGLENLALIHGQLGDQVRMGETFEILLRDFPETPAKAKANYWLGRAAFDAKNWKKAAPHLAAARTLDKEQFMERASLALLLCYYNLEDVDATEKEIEFYKNNGGKAETSTDVIRWLGQKYYERGDYEKSVKYMPLLVMKKEAVAEDFLLLARSRVKLGKFKDAVDSFDNYLAMVKDTVPRVAGLIEKTDAQIGQKDWDGADKTIKEGLGVASEGKYNGELRLRAGEVEFGRGSAKKALQIFESIPVTLDDDDICPRALERAIGIHRKLGEEEEAKKLENQLRSKYPEYFQKKKVAKP